MLASSIALLAAAACGHMLIIRALLDNEYRLDTPRLVWRICYPILLATVFMFPVLLVLWFGAGGPRIFSTGDYSAIPLPWRLYLALCLAATGAGVAFLVPPLRKKRPAALLSEHIELLDARPSLGHAAAGHGLRGAITRFRLNEMLKLQISTRELLIRRLPPEWDGLSILHLSDLHLSGSPALSYYEFLAERCAGLCCDLIALSGDVLDDHDHLPWIAPALGRLQAPLGRCYVLGNHDDYEDPRPTRKILDGLGWVDVSSRILTIQHKGRPLVIAGSEMPWMGEHPDFSTAPSEAFRLLITHTPHDFKFAVRNRVDLAVAGHLHGGQIRLPLLGAIRGGWFNRGVFERHGTVMHVSQGVGAMTPVRFACPPEVCKLILRPAPTA